MADFENNINDGMEFPVEVLIQDNLHENVIVAEHWHTCFELLYILKGSALQKVNTKTYTVNQGDFIFLRNGDIHSTICTPEIHTKICVLKFMPSLLYSKYTNATNTKYLTAFLNQQLALPLLTPAQRKVFEHFFSAIEQEVKKQNTGYDFYIKGYILQLMGYLEREQIIMPYKSPLQLKDRMQIEKILQYIEKNYWENLNLQEIAHFSNMNYSYTSRYFKKSTGRNFKEYLDFVRVQEANRLLIETDQSITEIASLCGFSCPQSMSRTYSRLMGGVPSAIRKVKNC